MTLTKDPRFTNLSVDALKRTADLTNTGRIAALERGTSGGGGGGSGADPATSTHQGKLKLAGDFGGTADTPTVIGSLTSKPEFGSMGFGAAPIVTTSGNAGSPVGRDMVLFGSGAQFGNAGVGIQWSDFVQNYDFDAAMLAQRFVTAGQTLHGRRSNFNSRVTARSGGQVSTGGLLGMWSSVIDQSAVQSVGITGIDATGVVTTSGTHSFINGERVLIYGTSLAGHNKSWIVSGVPPDTTHFTIRGKTTISGAQTFGGSGVITVVNGMDLYSAGNVNIGGNTYTYTTRTATTLGSLASPATGTAASFADGDIVTQTPPASASTGGTANNAPFMYSYSATASPRIARSIVSGDAANGDDVGCFGAINGGTARATDAFYLSVSPGVTGSGWITGWTMDSDVDYGVRLGLITVGQDNALGAFAGLEYGAGFDASNITCAAGAHAIRIPNQGRTAGGGLYGRIYNPSIGGTNFRQLIGLNSLDQVWIAGDNSSVIVGTDVSLARVATRELQIGTTSACSLGLNAQAVSNSVGLAGNTLTAVAAQFYMSIPRNGAMDLGRSSGNVLRVFSLTAAATPQPANAVFNISSAGNLSWGAGGASALDNTLSRFDSLSMAFGNNLRIGGSLKFTGTTNSGLHFLANTSSSTGITLATSDAKLYVRNNKLILAYNDAGTVRYRYTRLNNALPIWQYNGTTEPNVETPTQDTGWAPVAGFTPTRAFDSTDPVDVGNALATLVTTLKTYGILG